MCMKRALALAAILSLVVLSTAGVRAEEKATASLDVKLSVNGMTCANCAGKVQAALEKVPGVTKAQVILEKNEADVSYDKGKTTPEALVKAVEKVGYKCSLKKPDQA